MFAPELTLTLFVLRILTDDPNHALTPDDLAFRADTLD
jgi:hypothetical protein